MIVYRPKVECILAVIGTGGPICRTHRRALKVLSNRHLKRRSTNSQHHSPNLTCSGRQVPWHGWNWWVPQAVMVSVGKNDFTDNICATDLKYGQMECTDPSSFEAVLQVSRCAIRL
eukprot:1193281-Prorocentrum_minimum.AAC.2